MSTPTQPIALDVDLGGSIAGTAGAVPDSAVDLNLTNTNDRALANEALRNAHDREQALIDVLRDGFLSVDNRGVVAGANRAATHLFGTLVEGLIGTPIDQLLETTDSTRGPISGMLVNALRTGSHKIAGARGTRRDGGGFNCELTVAEAHRGNDSARWFVIVMPSATRSPEELQLRESVKMEAISAFAGRMANDFNNALAAISGSVEAARMSHDPAEIRADLDAVVDASTGAARLVRCLMNFAYPPESQKRTIDPGRIIERAVSVLRHDLSPGIKILMDLHHGDWICEADAEQIQDILVNLGQNSGEALHGGGTFAISSRAITRLGATGENGTQTVAEFVRIDVVDDGAGIPADVLPRIFEPMFTTKRPGTGSGLGLAFVYDSLKQHGGGITVESTVNCGTQFHIFLPRFTVDQNDSVVSQGHPTGASNNDSTTAKGTVLFVDDEDAVRRPCVRALEHNGFAVVQARDGREGIELFEEHRESITAVVLDIVMPDVDGWGVLTHLRASAPDLPVLMVSGYSGRTNDPAAQAVRPDRFLKKPFELADLVGIVRELTQEREG